MVTVAIIDSGVDSKIVECTTIDVLNKGYSDKCGHGTACAMTIKNRCKESELISIPLLDEYGMANSLELEEVLQSCLSMNCDIINLSLSILDKNAGRIKEICSELREQGKIILASVTNRMETSVPAVYEDVIGVRGKLFDLPDTYWFDPKRKIQMIADMTPVFTDQSLGRYLIFSGNSKAAALASGLLAQIMVENKGEINETILKKLRLHAAKNEWEDSELLFDSDELKKNILVGGQEDIMIQLVEIIKDLVDMDVKEIGRDENLFSLGIIIPSRIEILLSEINRKFGLAMNLKNTMPQDFITINNLFLAIRRVSNGRTD